MQTISYGDHPDQWLRFAAPAGQPIGTVVLLHGGFWRSAWSTVLMEPVAADLLGRGWSVANVEFRRMSEDCDDGIYPMILDDVAHAINLLATGFGKAIPRPLVTIGHSAGGQLALWAAAGQPVAEPSTLGTNIPLDGAVAQAGVLDLVGAAHAQIGRNAVALMMGASPEQEPARYDQACPTRLLPLGVPQLLVHGMNDEHVPWEMSARYHRSAQAAGDDVELALLTDVGHFEHLDPSHVAWQTVIEWLARFSESGRVGDVAGRELGS